jgi:hypothetical protein
VARRSYLAQSFDTLGWILRDLRDAPLLAEVIRQSSVRNQFSPAQYSCKSAQSLRNFCTIATPMSSPHSRPANNPSLPAERMSNHLTPHIGTTLFPSTPRFKPAKQLRFTQLQFTQRGATEIIRASQLQLPNASHGAHRSGRKQCTSNASVTPNFDREWMRC